MEGKELRQIRKANRLNQEQFGLLVGAHRVTVSDWENGRADVPGAVEIIARIVDQHPELLPKIERWAGVRK